MTHQYYVYLMASRGKTLYVGVTNNLERRVYEHKSGLVAGFTKKYRVTKLVYHEETPDVGAAIAGKAVEGLAQKQESYSSRVG